MKTVFLKIQRQVSERLQRAALLTLLLAVSLPSFAVTFTFNGIKYQTLATAGEVEVASQDYPLSGDIVIPEIVSDGVNNYTVTAIGDYSFSGSYLTSVVIPNTVTSIGTRAFHSCGLSSVTIPNSVLSIGENAFRACSNLTEVSIPESVTEIIGNPFFLCSKLSAVKVDKANKNFCSVDGVLFDRDMTTLICYPIAKSGTSYSIPSTVKTIGEESFAYSGLTMIELPNSVTSIGQMAFNGSPITSMNIPASVTEIKGNPFQFCGNLSDINVDNANKDFCSVGGVLFTHDKTVLKCYPIIKKGVTYTIPATVRTIGECAFNSNKELQSVIIPNSVTSIETSAFGACKISSVEIPNSVTSIGEGAFEMCESLTSAKLPASLTSIEDYTFMYCTHLELIEIPESVKSIGTGAFRVCSSLKSVTIPSSVTEFGEVVWCYCDNLENVYYAAEHPVAAPKNLLFSQVTYNGATLHVRESALNEIKETEPWSLFLNIEATDFSGIGDVAVDDAQAASAEVFDLNGVRLGSDVDNLPAGVYIVRQGSQIRKVAITR